MADTFILHTVGGDKVFAKFFERDGPGPYGFPLHIGGIMYFWRNKIHRVILDTYRTVVLNYDGKDDVSVEIRRK